LDSGEFLCETSTSPPVIGIFGKPPGVETILPSWKTQTRKKAKKEKKERQKGNEM